jgi:hypothetical protein
MHVERLLLALSIAGAPLASCRSTHQTVSPGSPESDTVLVRVVDGESGEPAAGARVDYVDESSIDVRNRDVLMWSLLSPENVREWLYSSTKADGRGEARVPRATHGIEATLGSKWGASDAGSHGKDTVVVRLEKDHSKRARVVDELGKPVGGVNVMLFDASGDEDAEASADQPWGRPLWLGRSRLPDGVVEIAHWQLVRTLPEDTPLRMCVMLTDVDESARCVHLSRDEREVPTFTVRAPGSVVVNVHRRDGSPAPDKSLVELFAMKKLPADAAADMDASDDGADEQAGFAEHELTAGGRVMFPAVSAGTRLTITARAWDGTRRAQATIDGPHTAGEILSVDVTLGERLPTLTGRLVDEHGAPLAWHDFNVEWNTKAASLGLDDDDAVTDGRGRFRLDIDDLPVAEPGRELELHITTLSGDLRDTRSLTIVGARVAVKEALTPADHDLGDIVMRADETPPADATHAP